MNRMDLVEWGSAVAWLVSLAVLPIFKIHIPGALWAFPLLVMIMMAVASIEREPTRRYISYA
ncbi:MAG: hypothetical protein ACP5GZ_12055, partial [Vulcanisaeta sp.]|uniref:hypothetical protein n=1 Tax=Vulcanisaeta sp. TaxID=2020871 RepID=UPI003D0D74DF